MKIYLEQVIPKLTDGLLSDPDLVGIGGDSSNSYLTKTQFDEEKHIDGLKPNGFHREEITNQNLILVGIP